jgi:uncharacterized protein YndB with AHSA1/START domain
VPRPIRKDDAIFAALAEPTRRALMDALFEKDGRTLLDLESVIPGLSRFGVMMHLRVLENAGLLTTKRAGRFKHHYLNAAPLALIYDRWVHKYLQSTASALISLKRQLEEEQLVPTSARHVTKIAIRSTPERVWQAITDPEFSKQYYYGAANRSDWTVGSRWTSEGPAGELYLEGQVLEAEPPKRLAHTFHVVHEPGAAADPPSRVTWEIVEERPGICVVTVTHDGFGSEDSPSFGYATGWPWILSGMKTLLETGSPLQRAV